MPIFFKIKGVARSAQSGFKVTQNGVNPTQFWCFGRLCDLSLAQVRPAATAPATAPASPPKGLKVVAMAFMESDGQVVGERAQGSATEEPDAVDELAKKRHSKTLH